MSTPDVQANVASVRTRIANAARRAARDPDEVRLVAVTKTFSSAVARAAVEAGVMDLGENRAQDLVAKAPSLVDLAPTWHFIGALQRNKVKPLAPHVGWWQSVDRAELGPLLARHAPAARVLVEINIADEPQKAGCPSADAASLVDSLRALDLDVAGVMAVPPLGADPRSHFDRLREIADAIGLTEVSMGMTDDFEIAIEHGATIVRVGRAIFGPRPAAPGVER